MNHGNTGRLAVLCAILVIGTCGCCACKNRRPKPQADAARRPVIDTVEALKLYPFQVKKGKFQITEGALAGMVRSYSLEPDGESRWKLILTDVRIVYYQVNEDGSIAVRGEDEFADDVAVRYDPPLIVLPAKLVTGKTYESQGAMKVTGLTSGAAREQGTCKIRVSLQGRDHIEAGNKTLHTYRIQTIREIKLKLATARIDATTDFAEDYGPVRDRMEQVTRILGLIPSRKVEGMLMMD